MMMKETTLAYEREKNRSLLVCFDTNTIVEAMMAVKA